ncbi:MAG: PetM family cytochrome b6-f complex subunit 7 [Cyanobacteriota bacterium]|jgi:cytochrome b6-f complex subunit 7|nr:PetM family cytochrome b6-f complex subunit 7 [Cyanobacteriota bacterium]
MAAEIFNTSIIIFTLTLVGLGLGFVMLRIQGGEE